MKRIIFLLSSILITNSAFAEESKNLGDRINDFFVPIVDVIAMFIFWDPIAAMGFEIGASIPIVVVWLVFGALFFTIKMNFINVTAFRHAIDLVRGKYDDPNDEGEVSHFQALATALSATVGLGNIAGVAVAITVGGPGATFWMIVAGLLGMSSKFVECTLGVKYRVVNKNGEVSGGPMYYLKNGLAKYGYGNIGKVLAVLFAILCIGGSFGGGNMFQANQAYAQLSGQFPMFAGNGPMFGFLLAILVGTVIIGGIKSIARVTEKIVPFMAVLYVAAALVILVVNFSDIGNAFAMIFKGAFAPSAAFGGFIGVIIQGFRRAAFSNEAGVGSASIAHSATKTNEPVSEGIVSLLEPFIDTVVICTMTALVIIVTGMSGVQGVEGAQLTSQAFESVISWFPYVLVIAIFLFAFSTMISWSYYGIQSWKYLFGKGKVADMVYKFMFLAFIIIGSAASMNSIWAFSDAMIFAMVFPNMIGLYFLFPVVREQLNKYLKVIKEAKV